MEIVVKAPAKINLTLNVGGRREDGYHQVDTIMQTVDLADRITVRLIQDGSIHLHLSDSTLPADEHNTAWKAAAAFFQQTQTDHPGVEIHIQKNIPQQAGLAGGSADAAGLLVALDRLLDTRLTTEQLCDIGAGIGADVPFCVLGGAAFAEGIGTILSPLPSMPDCFVVIARPDCGVSTREAYRRIDAIEPSRRPNHSVVTDALCAGDLATISRNLCNVFEEAIALPDVQHIQKIMRCCQTLGSQMTGSGSAVFGFFEDKAQASHCAELLRKTYSAVFVCRPCSWGPLAEKMEDFV